jgi:hypothetical protein
MPNTQAFSISRSAPADARRRDAGGDCRSKPQLDVLIGMPWLESVAPTFLHRASDHPRKDENTHLD